MIKLDADETMLLLVAKGHQHMAVLPATDATLGSLGYIQMVCDVRCFGEIGEKPRSDMFTPYMHLARKLLSATAFAAMFERLNQAFFWHEIFGKNREEPPIGPDDLMNALIGGLATRRVTDLELDESLIQQKVTNAA